MRHLLRWLSVGILLLVTMISVGGLILLYGASREQVIATGVSDFEQTTGLKVELGDGFQPMLWPIPGWQLGPVTITGLDTDAPFLTAESSLLTLAPAGLLQRTFNIGALWLDQVEVRLPENDAITLAPPERTPRISFLRLRNAEIEFGTAGVESDQRASLAFASLDYAGAKRPMRLALSGIWRGRKINAEAKLTSPDRAARGDWIFADADLSVDGDTASYQGRFKTDFVGEFPVVSGNLMASIANPAGAISWLTQGPPDDTLIHVRNITLEGRAETLPERLLLRTRWVGDFRETRISTEVTLRGDAEWQQTGTGTLNVVARAGGLFSGYLNGSFAREHGISGDLSLSVLDLPGMFDAQVFSSEYRLSDARSGSVKGRLSATSQGVALADARLLLGQDRYAGDAAIDLRGERPIVSIGTSLETLRLDDWVDPVLDGRQPLAGLLPNLDPDLVVEVNAETVRYGDLTAGPMVASIATRSEGMELDVRQLDIAGGILAASAQVATNSNIAKVDLTGAEIDSAALLEKLGLSGLSGIAGGSMQADVPIPIGEQSWSDIRADGELSLFQTRIDGIDLRSGQTGPAAQTRLAQTDLAFGVTNGVIRARDIKLRDALGGMTASGSIRLSDLTLEGSVAADDEPDSVANLGGTLGELTIQRPEAPSETTLAPPSAETSSADAATEIEDAILPNAQDETASLPKPKPRSVPREVTTDAVETRVPDEESGEAVSVVSPAAPLEESSAETTTVEATQLSEAPNDETLLPEPEPMAPENAPLPRARR